jgi:6-pyruvoyltetrahydropterin/6-carboxytetrahydropterin synthase
VTKIVRIGKTFRFEAAHHLPNHEGKCARPHGHSYRVDIELAGTPRPADGSSSEGMVCDFADVSEAWFPLHALLDHRDLNDVLPERYQPTTAENVACFIAAELSGELGGLAAVTVWETATSWARVDLQVEM